MNNQLQKPAFCDQEWLDMKPTQGGRVCGECTKTIVDFRKNTWAEIQARQAASNNAVCGIYTNRQLKYWGREVPSKTQGCKRAAAMLAAMATLLAATPLVAQNSEINPIERVKQSPSTIIKGAIIDETGEPLMFANVVVNKNGEVCTGVASDVDGNFEIDISECLLDKDGVNIQFSYVGYGKVNLQLDEIKQDNVVVMDDVALIKYDVVMPPAVSVTAFYVRNPSYTKKFGWRVKRFTRKIRNVFRK